MKVSSRSVLTKATMLFSALSTSCFILPLGLSVEQASAQSSFIGSTASSYDTAQIEVQKQEEAVSTLTAQHQVEPKSGRRRSRGGCGG